QGTTLAKGVLKAMFVTKLKIALVVLVVGSLGGWGVLEMVQRGQTAEPVAATSEDSATSGDPVRGQGLHKLVSLNADQTPLDQVIADLREQSNIDIIIDLYALKKHWINDQQPVSLKLENVPLQTALTEVLEPAHLQYVPKEDVLLIIPERIAPTVNPQQAE